MLSIDNVVDSNLYEIDSLLRKQFNKQLFYPKQDDKYRLLRLRVWSNRYKISIGYILSVLIPYFEKMAYKHSRSPRERISKGIGTTISVLTGVSAEQHVLDAITKDFSDGEHIIAWKQEQQIECIRKVRDADSIQIKKPKGVLSYPTLTAYRKAYTTRIKNTRDEQEKLVKQLSRQPYRGNPFR